MQRNPTKNKLGESGLQLITIYRIEHKVLVQKFKGSYVLGACGGASAKKERH